MALHWNLTKIERDEEIRLNEQQWQITNAIIWLTMIIGMREITKKNYLEFAARIKVYEKVYGTYLSYCDENGKRQDWPITTFDIKRRIGLSTNASSLTKAQFLKNISEMLLRDQTELAENEEEFTDGLTEIFGEPRFEFEAEEAA